MLYLIILFRQIFYIPLVEYILVQFKIFTFKIMNTRSGCYNTVITVKSLFTSLKFIILYFILIITHDFQLRDI